MRNGNIKSMCKVCQVNCATLTEMVNHLQNSHTVIRTTQTTVEEAPLQHVTPPPQENEGEYEN